MSGKSILETDNIISAQLIPENIVQHKHLFGRSGWQWIWFWCMKVTVMQAKGQWWNHLVWPTWGESSQWFVAGAHDTIIYVRAPHYIPDDILALAQRRHCFYAIRNLHGFDDNPDPTDTMPYVEHMIPRWDTVNPAGYKLSGRGRRVLFDKYVLELPNAYPTYHISPGGDWLALVVPDRGTALTKIKG